MLAALFLIGKTMHLQVFDQSIRDRARTSAIQKKVLYPSRGLIYDRHGELMIYNDPIYDLMVTYNQLNPDNLFTFIYIYVDKF